MKRLSMSTLSFQDFVRERMLKRRQEAMSETSRFPDDAADMPFIGSYQEVPQMPAAPAAAAPARPAARAAEPAAERSGALGARMATAAPVVHAQPARAAVPPMPVPMLHDTLPAAPAADMQTAAAARRDQEDMMEGAAPREGPDRGALRRRPGLHGEAAAPAGARRA